MLRNLSNACLSFTIDTADEQHLVQGERMRNVVRLSHIRVHHAFQRRGIATTLVRICIAHACRIGVWDGLVIHHIEKRTVASQAFETSLMANGFVRSSDACLVKKIDPTTIL